MDRDFVIRSSLILLPITLLFSFFLAFSLAVTDTPIGNGEGYAHFYNYMPSYPPLSAALSNIFGYMIGKKDGFILLALASTLVTPFFLLCKIRGRLEEAAFYAYGTTIPTMVFVNAFIPQMLVVNLMLAVFLCEKKVTPLLLLFLLGFSSHTLGGLAMLVAIAYRWYFHA